MNGGYYPQIYEDILIEVLRGKFKKFAFRFHM